MWNITVISENEERYFASESLTGILRPDLLEEKNSNPDSFVLLINDSTFDIYSMHESPKSIELVFNAKGSTLHDVLNLDPSQVKIKCSDHVVARDLSGYDVRSSIINIENNDYKVTLEFEKNQVGLING